MLNDTLAFQQQPIEKLVDGERELEDEYPMYGTYCYIAELEDGSLHLFSSNQHGITVADAKRYGPKKIYNCQLVKRGLM